jgi:transcriptional regulator with PAS, ATPase and Fis domain
LLELKKIPQRYTQVHSVISAPILSKRQIIGVVNLIRTEKSHKFNENDLANITDLADQIGDFFEGAEIRIGLFNQNIRLQKNLENRYSVHGIIGKSPKFKEVYKVLEQVIPTNARVVIHGESGSGKELVARSIHYAGPRKDQAFVAVDCGALPPNLLESELFGYVRGAFTGAMKDRQGLIEEAHNGTLFLDEITNMSQETQAKLLRFIQEEEIRPIGSNQFKKVDVRIIVAASAHLNEEISPEKIRPDLYYRLNVISIKIPPLRDRIEDIPDLSRHFLKIFSKKHHKALSRISPKAMQCLERYTWPGNIRELENLIERAVVMADYEAKILETDDLSIELLRQPGELIQTTLDGDGSLNHLLHEFESKLLLETLNKHHWNQTSAASELNISEAVMRYKIKRLNLKKTSL